MIPKKHLNSKIGLKIKKIDYITISLEKVV